MRQRESLQIKCCLPGDLISLPYQLQGSSTTDLYRSYVRLINAIDFCVSSSNALQQRPSLRGGGGELPAAAGWRGPVEPQR